MINEPNVKETMPHSETDIRARIVGYLAYHPESTTHEIAAGLGLDFGDVQTAVCLLLVKDQIAQPGKRQTVHGLRPIYRVAPNKGTT